MNTINTIEEFKEEYNYSFNWFSLNICSSEVLDYYINNYDDIDWVGICEYQPLPELFIDKYTDKINWLVLFNNDDISLSDGLIEKYLYQFNLYEAYHNIEKSYDIIDGSFVVIYKNKGHNRYSNIFEKLKNNYPHKYQIDKLEYEHNKYDRRV